MSNRFQELSSQIVICTRKGSVINDGKLKKLNSENKQKRISVSHLCEFLKLKVS